MKSLIFIFAAILMTSCATKRCGISELSNNTRIIYAIDSENTQAEDPNNPGVFYPVLDTIKIKVTNKGYKTYYEILKD